MSEEPMDEFLAQSTFHGAQHVDRTNHKFGKIFWSFVLLCGFAFVSYQIVELIQTFLRYPTVTSVSVKYPDYGLQMPNITACVQNRASKLRIKQGFPDVDMELLEYLSSSFLSAYSTTLYNIEYFRHYTKRQLPELQSDYEKFLVEYNMTILEFFQNVSFQCSDVFQDPACWFQNTYLFYCCKYARQFFSHNGPCFTFNLNAQNFTQKLPGPVGGFGFMYWHPLMEMLPTVFNSYQERAVHLFLSPEDAILNQNPIAIRPGSHAHVSIQATRHIKVERSFQQECQGDKKLRLFAGQEYTYSRCQLECMVDTFESICNCTGINTYLDIDPSHYCHPREGLDCFKSVAYELPDYLSNCRQRKCKESCVYWDYLPTVSTGQIFHPQFETQVADYWRLTKRENITESLIIVDYYFSEIKYVEIRELHAFTLETFVSNIGGALGLWTGASVITIVHCIYYILEKLLGNSKEPARYSPRNRQPSLVQMVRKRQNWRRPKRDSYGRVHTHSDETCYFHNPHAYADIYRRASSVDRLARDSPATSPLQAFKAVKLNDLYL